MSVKKDLITEKDVNELLYYGTYNGYIAVLVKSSISFQQVTTPTIADTTFYFANGGETLLLFHNGK